MNPKFWFHSSLLVLYWYFLVSKVTKFWKGFIWFLSWMIPYRLQSPLIISTYISIINVTPRFLFFTRLVRSWWYYGSSAPPLSIACLFNIIGRLHTVVHFLEKEKKLQALQLLEKSSLLLFSSQTGCSARRRHRQLQHFSFSFLRFCRFCNCCIVAVNFPPSFLIVLVPAAVVFQSVMFSSTFVSDDS